MTRHGFALVAVLWLLTAAGALGIAGTLAAREALATARHRTGHVRAAWRAEGCVERARAALEAALAAGETWESAGDQLPRPVAAAGCAVTLRPAGYAVDANAANQDRLVRLFAWLDVPASESDSLAAAILDWRDADDEPRAGGTEGRWYRTQGRPEPRNAPLADPLELALVRGLERGLSADSLLGTEEGRTPINLAPLPVIASLPGMTPELLQRLDALRRRGERIAQLGDLLEGVSAAARESLLVHFGELAGAATIAPDAWILAGSSSEGSPAISATVELRLVAVGSRAAIVRRRVW